MGPNTKGCFRNLNLSSITHCSLYSLNIFSVVHLSFGTFETSTKQDSCLNHSLYKSSSRSPIVITVNILQKLFFRRPFQVYLFCCIFDGFFLFNTYFIFKWYFRTYICLYIAFCCCLFCLLKC